MNNNLKIKRYKEGRMYKHTENNFTREIGVDQYICNSEWLEYAMQYEDDKDYLGYNDCGKYIPRISGIRIG